MTQARGADATIELGDGDERFSLAAAASLPPRAPVGRAAVEAEAAGLQIG